MFLADTIRELEKRIQVLTLDAEKVSSAKQSLEQNKIELESRVEQLSADYNEYKIRYEQLGMCVYVNSNSKYTERTYNLVSWLWLVSWFGRWVLQNTLASNGGYMKIGGQL